MFRPAFLRSLITGLGIAVVATACTPENVSSPQASRSSPSAAIATQQLSNSATASPNRDLLGGSLQPAVGALQAVAPTVSNLLFPVVQRQVALGRPITVTGVIGVGGGTIAIGEAGVSITFAPGAVRGDTPITVTADSGSAVSYEFGPHGTQFDAPVTIQQDMSLTTLADNLDAASHIMGGYAPKGLGDIIGGRLAHVSELHKATTKIVSDPSGHGHLGASAFIIKHFSGYMLISA